VLGLGVGALAAYAEPSDRLRFYEINPAVEPLARRFFPFLASSRARTNVIVGDGRLLLRSEPAHGFDVLVLDAFSSDGVPTHLLTLEAFGAYARVLRPDGVLAINVSSRHFQIERVVAGAASGIGMACEVFDSAAVSARGLTRARWALLARHRNLLDPLRSDDAHELLVPDPVLWTDAHSSLWAVAR
jgi:spermidine synthase